MDNAFVTTTNDFSFTTESDIDCFLENQTSLCKNDVIQDNFVNTNDKAMFILIYGIGGVLIFYFLYSICTAYYLHIKENLQYQREHREQQRDFPERQRTRRLLWPSNASTPVTSSSIFERGYISEEMRDMLDRPSTRPNTQPKQVCQNTDQTQVRPLSHATIEDGYTSEVFRDMLQRSTRAKHVYQSRQQTEMTHASPHPSAQPENERRFFPEDFLNMLQPNTATRHMHESREQIELRSMSSASSTPPITERTFFYEDFPDMFPLNTIPKQVNRSCEETELGSWSYRTPTPPESQRRFFPEDFLHIFQSNSNPEEMHKCENQTESSPSRREINKADTTPERIDAELPSLIERKTKSSPCSPIIVRRLLHSAGESPRRPSSWRT